MIDVENILIGMPQIINLSSILSVVVTGNIELSYFLIYNLTLGNGLNALIKYILQKTQILPKKLDNDHLVVVVKKLVDYVEDVG